MATVPRPPIVTLGFQQWAILVLVILALLLISGGVLL